MGSFFTLEELARADESDDKSDDARAADARYAPLDRRKVAAWDHFEISMGFLAGQRSYTSTPFTMTSGGTDGASSLVKPFQSTPYDRVNAYGLRWDARLVVSYVRMTVGYDQPFMQLRLGDGENSYAVGGTTRDVQVRSLRSHDLRFGIGVEYPVGPIAPFIDVLGSIHWVDTTLSIDGASHDYAATTVGFAARAGFRLHVRKWFFASLSGEVGMVGDERWGAELAVGFSI
ncbi:hypothetical protein BH09MYX1_BH09MYX1_22500 [soil metagenome]